MIWPEIKTCYQEYRHRWEVLQNFMEISKKQARIQELETQMSAPDFWDSPTQSKAVIAESNQLKKMIEPILALGPELEELATYIELFDEVPNPESTEEFSEIEALTESIRQHLENTELQSFLSGRMDPNNAILTIHAGAGGTEACDWAEMLLRMYLRWAEIRGFTTEIQDLQAGEEAGISRAVVRIVGDFAYGYAKAERGVHRLVRISPFDSNKRRHTSFCAVDVIAEVEDDIDIEIKEEDLRIDTYRSSGKGGQHVNKTESAIRITHFPSGIVVTCQNERSQIKNREVAMRTLRARLYEKMEDEKRSEMEKFYGAKGEIGWGNQIRSYVFQPYQLVKDLRTNVETGNIQAVMDGQIDLFINAWLRAGGPQNRS